MTHAGGMAKSLCLIFLRASTAARLSRRGGTLSMGSSVKLKSPRTKSGCGMWAWDLRRSVWAQRSGCFCLSTGAYTFIIVVFGVPDHAIVRTITRPGIRAWTVTFLGEMRALLIMKATPAEPLGLLGLYE